MRDRVKVPTTTPIKENNTTPSVQSQPNLHEGAMFSQLYGRNIGAASKYNCPFVPVYSTLQCGQLYTTMLLIVMRLSIVAESVGELSAYWTESRQSILNRNLFLDRYAPQDSRVDQRVGKGWIYG